MTNEDTKPKYWGIWHGENIVFRGTHTECWNHLVTHYRDSTVGSLQEQSIRIARTN